MFVDDNRIEKVQSDTCRTLQSTNTRSKLSDSQIIPTEIQFLNNTLTQKDSHKAPKEQRKQSRKLAAGTINKMQCRQKRNDQCKKAQENENCRFISVTFLIVQKLF